MSRANLRAHTFRRVVLALVGLPAVKLGGDNMQFKRMILIGLASTSIAACEQEPAPTTEVERNLMVTGPREDVERFIRLQEALSPPLKTWPISDLSDGRAWATVTIPAERPAEDVTHTTREAIAAGLTWWFPDMRPAEMVTLP